MSVHTKIIQTAKDLSFSYGKARVLEGISLQIQANEVVALLGPSGCGKSTLLKVLAGFLNPDDKRQLNTNFSVNDVAFVFQSSLFVPWLTSIGNVKIASRYSSNPQTAVDLLASVGLSDAMDKYPWQLSGGMQRRLSVALAFALGRPVVMMDEPTSGLDDWTRESLLGLLKRMLRRNGKTTVFATHNLQEAVTLADRVVYMLGDPGRIAFSDFLVDRAAVDAPDSSTANIFRVSELLRSKILDVRESIARLV